MINRLEQLQKMLDGQPKDSFLNHATALEYSKIGEYEKAASHFKIVIDNDPDYVGSYYHLGKVFESLNENRNALRTYENGAAIAQKLGNTRTLSELNEAKSQLEDE